ncbi:LGFP repeat-containing protein [Nocardia mexicana]|uniref:LGFP repeat-containing protein n=2 Tax=Nocardia mexicana TaxID=279262 RepID=A0A370GXV6_9NOCA|nr:LGFP repeat-containing protein [Nocardia mexicana]
MPYRRPKRPFILPVVTTLAVIAPLAGLVLRDTPDYHSANESNLAAIPAQMAEVALSSAPDVVLPLRELTGLNLPDLRLSDLRKLPLPRSVHLPPGLPMPPGVQLPSEIPLPQFGQSDPTAVQPAPRRPTGTSPGFIAGPLDDTAPADPGVAPAPGGPGTAPAPADAVNPAPGSTGNATAGEPVPAPGFAADPATPALAPGAIAPELADKVGAEVKELTRETPFSMVALTAKDLAGTSAMVRARTADGSWGPWFSTEQVDTRRNDHAAPGRTGTEPIYVGKTKAVQVLTTRKAAAAPIQGEAPSAQGDATPGPSQDGPAPAQDGTAPAQGQTAPAPVQDETAPGPVQGDAAPAPAQGDPAPARGDAAPAPVQGETAPAQGGSVPTPGGPTAARSDDPAQVTAAALSAVLIDPGRGAADENLSAVAAPVSGGGPKVITRQQWGADESLRTECGEPTVYDDGVGGITVHHTAGRNDYSKAESAGIVRAIYAYHAKTLNWCDIGYNTLVDKYGQIFEGRYGGMDKAVQGAHAGGFNENTSGVALMGDFETEPPTDAALQAAGQFIGWRARVAGLNPAGKTTMYSEGTEFTPYAEGEAVQLPTVFAHRDVGNTTCPGDAAYALMDRIREIAASSGGSLGTRAGNNTAPGTRRTQSDLAALADMTTKLLGMVGENAVARYWSTQGGPDGHLGAAASEPQPTRDGGQYAKFANGYVYADPNGKVIEVVGHILDRFVQLGAETGTLGLPLGNAYPVPDGQRSDFQYGSLILNQVTGIVTTLLKNPQQQRNSTLGQNAEPLPGQIAAPGQVGAPGQAPAPGQPSVPDPAPASVPVPEPHYPAPAE